MSGELLLSVDFEDWHQLVRRRVGASNWREPGPALERQTETMLALFDELGARCTFFILGMAARAHPQLVEQVVESGHEIACHGDAHLPVFTQTREEFATDVRRAAETIEELTGQRPIGYRAPAFSITRSTPWAHEVLAEQGFRYDASEHDSPILRDRPSAGAPGSGAHAPGSGAHTPGSGARAANGARRLPGAHLWELPVAAVRWRSLSLPLGGASYWAVTPTPLILRGLERAPDDAGLYLHPHELDPEQLRPLLGDTEGAGQRVKARLRTLQRNAARRRAGRVLREIAARHGLITYGDAYARLSSNGSAGS
jgi:polysaccharide deacetylase family protein (PEP-CTERM system associated)